MGLHKEIVRYIQKKYEDHGGKWPISKTFPSPPQAAQAVHLIEDTLTRVMRVHNYRDGTTLFTGKQFFDLYWRPFAQFFQDARHQNAVAVSSVDDSHNVPNLKDDTRKKRALIAAKRQLTKPPSRYRDPLIWEFEDGGIRNTADPTAPLQPFDLAEIADGDRLLRTKLFAYVRQYLVRHFDILMPAGGGTFYLELSRLGAWKFQRGKVPVQDPLTVHNHGESDPSVALFWLPFLGTHRPTRIVTIDSDILPMLVAVCERFPPTADIWWKCKTEVRNMRHCFVNLPRAFPGWTPQQFMLFCILNGTDFFDKKWLSHGLGLPQVAAAIDFCPQFADILLRRMKDSPAPYTHVWREPSLAEQATELAHVELFVRALYTAKRVPLQPRSQPRLYNRAPEQDLYSLEVLRGIRFQKNIACPSPAELRHAVHRAAQNLCYWYGALYLPDQVHFQGRPRAEEGEEPDAKRRKKADT